MSFLKEGSREYRQIKKALPYTVTPISDIKQLKAEQAVKEEKWQAGKPARYAEAKQRAVTALLGGDRSYDPQAEIEKQYNERQAALVKQVCRPELVTPTAPKQSVMVRIWSKVLNYFLDLKF